MTEVKSVVRRLMNQGFEIGLHGIDAWHHREKCRDELERIREVTAERDIGVRMHWLFHGPATAQVLEEAGACYDSTMGYNEAVGYHAGTAQVFRPPGVERLLELPLTIMDTALFGPARMGLDETEAREVILEILENSKVHGGVVTVNWHHRSIAPERLWDTFYAQLLNELEGRNVWFGTARQVVRWFQKRRSVTFDEVHWSGNELSIRLSSDAVGELPDLVLRVHRPRANRIDAIDPSRDDDGRGDLIFSGRIDRKIVV